MNQMGPKSKNLNRNFSMAIICLEDVTRYFDISSKHIYTRIRVSCPLYLLLGLHWRLVYAPS